MRRRLTIAILLLVAATLVVTSVGSYLFIRRAAISTVQQELTGQARAISTTFTSNTAITRRSFAHEERVIAQAGAFTGLEVVGITRRGTLIGTLPAGVTVARLDIPALRSGRQITGHTVSLLAYSAIPVPIARVTAYLPVLVITRQIHNPANGVRYFLLVGAVGLALAAVVAAGLARRFTRPLSAAVTTTRRIASGDLDATMPVRPREIPEFAQLADSINTMGGNLVRARDQERQFLLSVSHELRTPLTSIRGYADAVVEGAAEDPAAAAAVIGSEARRLERLVQDLLDLARLDADRFSFDLQRLDCAAVALGVIDGFRPRAADLGLALVVAPGSDRPLWVEADADRLSQVVANLVENAASFAAHRVVVGAGEVGGQAAVWVVDDGPGIPSDQLSRVFERHFVSDRVRGRRQGSGLGLAIVSELAAAMGASVRAESPVAGGRGTRMEVWLRPSPPTTPPTASASAPTAAVTAGPVPSALAAGPERGPDG
jgi:signal transduction histidine kinase